MVHHYHSGRHRGLALVGRSLVKCALDLSGLSLSLGSKVLFTDRTVASKLLLLLKFLVLPLVTPLMSASVVLAAVILHASLG